jgi:CRISPR-associated protein Cas8b1/Cst1 subtype I-B
MNMMIHTLSSEYINNKIQYNNLNNKNNNNKKYKIIVFNIPCDIMSFLKLNSSHDDINNIIDIAYKTSLAAF